MIKISPNRAFTMDSQGSDQQPFANDNHVQLNYNTLDDSSTDPTPTNNNQSSANNDMTADTGMELRKRTNTKNPAPEFSVEDAVEKMGFGWFQMKILTIGGVFIATDAMEMMLLSVLSPVLRCDWLLAEWEIALVTSVVFIGMFAGSVAWGKFSDKYGRHKTIMFGAIWIMYFGILTAFSPVLPWILILRGLVGFGFGGAIQSSTLMTEYLPSSIRAKALIISNFTWAIGSMLEVWMAFMVLPNWRLLVGLSAVPLALAVICLYFMPESSRYLVAAGHEAEALQVLQQGAKSNNAELPPGKLIASVQTERGRIKDLFSKHYWVTTLILYLQWFSAAFSYYGMVLLGSEILESEEAPECHCNLHTKSDYIAMIVATLGEFFAIPLNLLTVDFFGRKKSLAIDFTGAAVFFLIIIVIPREHYILITIALFGARSCTSGIFNIVYIYTGEVYPTSVRSVGLGTCSSMARIGAMISPFVAQVIRKKVSTTAAVIIYGVICGLSAIGSMVLPIETRGREMPQSVHQNPKGRD